MGAEKKVGVQTMQIDYQRLVMLRTTLINYAHAAKPIHHFPLPEKAANII